MKVFIIEGLPVSTNVTLNLNPRFCTFKMKMKIVKSMWVHFSEANIPVFFDSLSFSEIPYFYMTK